MANVPVGEGPLSFWGKESEPLICPAGAEFLGGCKSCGELQYQREAERAARGAGITRHSWTRIGGVERQLANDTIRAVAERVAQTHGVELVEVELKGGGKARTLRITIDKPEGVTHEDCANVSRGVSAILDVEDAVPGGSYTLEVSSPGLDRKLLKAEDYARYVGSRIKVTTYQPVNGNRFFNGKLESFQEGRLTLEIVSGKKKPKPGHAHAGQKVEIELANVEAANLVPEI